MRTLGHFVMRDLLHDRWRSLLTVIGLAAVVVGYLLLAALAQAIVSLSKAAPVNNLLLIVGANTIDPMDSSLDEGVLQAARQAAPQQILRTFPILFRHLTIDGHIMQIRAVPPEELPAAMALTLTAGSWPNAPGQVAVSEGGAQQAVWKIGSTVKIYGTDFQVSGLVRGPENAFGTVWMAYADGQRLFGMGRGFQVGYVVLEPSADPQSVRLQLLGDARIATQADVYLDSVYTNDFNQSYMNMVILSGLMVLISLLGITFGIYNATSLSLTERSREIGLLRLIGFTLGKLRSFLLVRAVILTGAAYGLGWLAALIFINQQRLLSSVNLVFQALQLTPWFSLAGLGLAVLFAGLGVWLSTARMAALSPLQGLD
jgi:hypothetical protein